MGAALRRTHQVSARATAAVALVLALGTVFVTDTLAAGSPSKPAAPALRVDGSDPHLKLQDGATLAPPKVLDITSVVEDLSGAERREDSSTDIKVALQSEVLFGKDSAMLSPAAHTRLAEVAKEIKKQKATQVRIFGFTDNLGSSAHGDTLSRQRAEAVRHALTKSLENITFKIRGYGEKHPVASNDTEEGRKKNRRVEISFHRAGNNQNSR